MILMAYTHSYHHLTSFLTWINLDLQITTLNSCNTHHVQNTYSSLNILFLIQTLIKHSIKLKNIIYLLKAWFLHNFVNYPLLLLQYLDELPNHQPQLQYPLDDLIMYSRCSSYISYFHHAKVNKNHRSNSYTWFIWHILIHIII